MLFQERLRHDPFWMLVACQLVNLTTWDKARHVFDELCAEYCTPEDLASADTDRVRAIVGGLGLGNRRSQLLVRMAVQWCAGPRRHPAVKGLPGCGRYAADSWAIFVEGRTDIEVTDGKLHWYLTKLKDGQ